MKIRKYLLIKQALPIPRTVRWIEWGGTGW
jgi:hypothetical protein